MAEVEIEVPPALRRRVARAAAREFVLVARTTLIAAERILISTEAEGRRPVRDLIDHASTVVADLNDNDGPATVFACKRGHD